jgi:hypothetical protein
MTRRIIAAMLKNASLGRSLAVHALQNTVDYELQEARVGVV